MELIDRYGADDRRSMAADNTSAFNCRFVAGTNRWSMHAYGKAIDINPIENPYVSGSHVSPPAGEPYADRSRDAEGMIHAGDAVVEAFASKAGWRWGGAWPAATRDYQHFSSNGQLGDARASSSHDVGAAAAARARRTWSELYALVEANRAHLAPWMPWAARQTLEGTLEFIRSRSAPERGRRRAFRWRWSSTSGSPASSATTASTARTCGVAIGYWLAEDATGERTGDGRRCAALVAHAFDEWELHRVEIRAAAGNARSRAVCERLGVPRRGRPARGRALGATATTTSSSTRSWRRLARRGAARASAALERGEEAPVLLRRAVGDPDVAGAAERRAGADDDPCSASAATISASSRSPSAIQEKLACESGVSRPSSRTPSSTVTRSTIVRSTRRVTSSEWRTASAGGRLGDGVDAERLAHGVDRGAERRRAERVADPQAGEPVDLGEGPQQDQVRELAAQVDGRVGVVVELELDVGLVDDHRDVLGDALAELGDPRRRQVGRGRVVRVADDQQLGRRGDLGEHRVEVVDVARRRAATRISRAPESGARYG